MADPLRPHRPRLPARIAQLRFQRSVLRAVASIPRPTAKELHLMYDLANLTAVQRRQIITDLVDEAFAGLDDPGPVAEKMRMATPDLPDDPSADQVAAWVELAQLVQDPAFRRRVREMAVAGAGSSAPDHGTGAALVTAVAEHAGAALAAGVDPASAEAAAILDRIAPEGDRAALADRLERFTDARVDRYWRLLAVINGWPAWPSQVPAFEWSITALRA